MEHKTKKKGGTTGYWMKKSSNPLMKAIMVVKSKFGRETHANDAFTREE